MLKERYKESSYFISTAQWAQELVEQPPRDSVPLDKQFIALIAIDCFDCLYFSFSPPVPAPTLHSLPPLPSALVLHVCLYSKDVIRRTDTLKLQP